MRTIAFFALCALAINAFNLTEYHIGIDAQLNFSSEAVEEGLTCLAALSASGASIKEIIVSENFDTIASELGAALEQIQTDLQTTCLPYFMAYFIYLGPYVVAANQTWNDVVKQNFETYHLQIIQQIAQWEHLLSEGQDYQAGQAQGYITQILFGIAAPTVVPAPQVNASAVVPVVYSKLFPEYFGIIFQTLGINATANVSALIECTYNLQNVTGNIVYIKQNFTDMDFNEKLDAVQYIMGLTFDAVRNCEGAAEVEGLLLVPVYEAFIEDPVTFTLEVTERIAMDLPEYINSMKQEVIDIQEGLYAQAGIEKVNRIINDFSGLVNFTSTN